MYVCMYVEVYLTSHHKQAISPPLIHVDDRRNERERGGDRSMERGRVEINKQSTSGLHQSKNGMGTYYIQNSFIHILQNTFTIFQSAIPQKHTSRKAFKRSHDALLAGHRTESGWARNGDQAGAGSTGLRRWTAWSLDPQDRAKMVLERGVVLLPECGHQ